MQRVHQIFVSDNNCILRSQIAHTLRTDTHTASHADNTPTSKKTHAIGFDGEHRDIYGRSAHTTRHVMASRNGMGNELIVPSRAGACALDMQHAVIIITICVLTFRFCYDFRSAEAGFVFLPFPPKTCVRCNHRFRSARPQKPPIDLLNVNYDSRTESNGYRMSNGQQIENRVRARARAHSDPKEATKIDRDTRRDLPDRESWDCVPAKKRFALNREAVRIRILQFDH